MNPQIEELFVHYFWAIALVMRGQSPTMIKLRFGIGLVGMAVAMGVLWFADLPVK